MMGAGQAAIEAMFSGEAAQEIVAALGEQVRSVFNLCARNLKARAEAL
jgi:hypothetical protein